MACSQKAAEVEPGERLWAQFCVQWAQYHRVKWVLWLVRVSWVFLPKLLIFLLKIPKVNLAEKPDSRRWVWKTWTWMMPSLRGLYIALSPSKKKKKDIIMIKFKIQDLSLRACGFCFHSPIVRHLQFSLPIDLTNSGSTSSPFLVCLPDYGCSENKPRTNLWCWAKQGNLHHFHGVQLSFPTNKGVCTQSAYWDGIQHTLTPSQTRALPGKCLTGTKAAAGKRVRSQTVGVLLSQVTNHALLLLTWLLEQWRVYCSFY